MGWVKKHAGSGFLGAVAGGLGFGAAKKAFGDLTGKNQANAAKEAGRLQYDAILKAIEEQRAAREDRNRLMQPYNDIGYSVAPQLTDLVNNPQGEYNYVKNNPLFQYATDRTMKEFRSSMAPKGLANSGAFLKGLQDRILSQGTDLVQNRYANLYRMLALGENAAAGQGMGDQNSANAVSDLYTQGGNALAGSKIGAANAKANGTGNMLGLASLAASLFI